MLFSSATVLRLVQLLINPFLSAGLQAVAQPTNYAPSLAATGMGTHAVLPYMPPRPATALPPGMIQPVFVPPSVVQALMQSVQTRVPQQDPYRDPYYYYTEQEAGGDSEGGSPGDSAGAASGLVASLQQALGQYTNTQDLSGDVASPMPMATLLTVISNIASGFRVMAINFVVSIAMMGAVTVARIVVQNLPIILSVLGLTRASMARVIAEGVTRAQCLERAACVLGRHVRELPATPGVLRWLRSPDGSTSEHPVWGAFRTAAEGFPLQCDDFVC